MTLFLTAFSFYSIFTQVPKILNCCSFAGGFLKHLGDTVLLDLVCLTLFCFFMSSRQTDDDQIRSLCGALAVLWQKSHWIITINGKMNVWKSIHLFFSPGFQFYILYILFHILWVLCSILCWRLTNYWRLIFLLLIFSRSVVMNSKRSTLNSSPGEKHFGRFMTDSTQWLLH